MVDDVVFGVTHIVRSNRLAVFEKCDLNLRHLCCSYSNQKLVKQPTYHDYAPPIQSQTDRLFLGVFVKQLHAVKFDFTGIVDPTQHYTNRFLCL